MIEEIEPVRMCVGCLDEWPDDAEFFASDRDPICLACRAERRSIRRARNRAAARAYRDRVRGDEPRPYVLRNAT